MAAGHCVFWTSSMQRSSFRFSCTPSSIKLSLAKESWLLTKTLTIPPQHRLVRILRMIFGCQSVHPLSDDSVIILRPRTLFQHSCILLFMLWVLSIFVFRRMRTCMLWWRRWADCRKLSARVLLLKVQQRRYYSYKPSTQRAISFRTFVSVLAEQQNGAERYTNFARYLHSSLVSTL